jgi:hypothetical protein
MKTNQMLTATISDVPLREFAEALLGVVAGWDGEKHLGLLEDEALLDFIHGNIEHAYRAGFQAAVGADQWGCKPMADREVIVPFPQPRTRLPYDF